MAFGHRFFRRIYQAEVDNPHSRFLEPLGYLLNILRQTFPESFELRPIRIEPDSEKPHCKRVARNIVAHMPFHSSASGTTAKPGEPEGDSIANDIYPIEEKIGRA